MIEIKFRYVFKNKKNGSILTMIEDIEELEIQSHWTNDPDMKDYELIDRLEYTRIKDKNGKEIYEGDILHIISYYDKEIDDDFIAIVVFNIDNDVFPPCYQLEPIKGDGFISQSGKIENKIEVIGNIYENPELIE